MEGVKNVTKPICTMAGLNGVDFYSLIGKVSLTLENAGQQDQADDFVHKSMVLDTWKDILTLSQDYVTWKEDPANGRHDETLTASRGPEQG